MRNTLAALSFAAGIVLVWCHGALAVPVRAIEMTEAVATAATLQQTFYVHRTRHYVRKCYDEFLIGPYVCHSFRRWF